MTLKYEKTAQSSKPHPYRSAIAATSSHPTSAKHSTVLCDVPALDVIDELLLAVHPDLLVHVTHVGLSCIA